MERNGAFDDMLDDAYSAVEIAGLEFHASDILYRCDPIAYRVYANDFDDAFGEDEEA
jgi:hypothetical protein